MAGNRLWHIGEFLARRRDPGVIPACLSQVNVKLDLAADGQLGLLHAMPADVKQMGPQQLPRFVGDTWVQRDAIVVRVQVETEAGRAGEAELAGDGTELVAHLHSVLQLPST